MVDHWRSLCLIHLFFLIVGFFNFDISPEAQLCGRPPQICAFSMESLCCTLVLCVWAFSLLVMELYGNAFSRRVNSRKPSEVAIFTLFMSPKLCSLAFNAFLEFCKRICSTLFTIQTTNVNVRMLPKVARLPKVNTNVDKYI